MPEVIDYYFPFIVFAYGCLFFILSSIPALEKLATENLNGFLYQRWQIAQKLSLICIFVGAPWILQRLWL